MAQYIYTTSSFSSSFGQIELCELTQEITGSSLISKELQYINRVGDTIYIYIEPSLSPAEESSLNDIIFYHSATASFCIPQEELLTDGSRPLSGNLNINGFNIVNVNLIDDIDIDSHSLRHLSGGFDEIDGDKLDIDFDVIDDIQGVKAEEWKTALAALHSKENKKVGRTSGAELAVVLRMAENCFDKIFLITFHDPSWKYEDSYQPQDFKA